jgi:hypothetical protein
MPTHNTNGPLALSSDSEPRNDEWDDLIDKYLDNPDAIKLIRYINDASGSRYQMEYGCYRVLKCKGAE